MAGRGPAPKNPTNRARRNGEPPPRLVLPFKPARQPALPSKMPDGSPWPPRTRVWWKMWKAQPISATFSATDWSELLDCAVLHGCFWYGDVKMASELRLRVAKFGATPEDRARLRIAFADAHEKETARVPASPGSTAKKSYSGLRVVGGADEAAVDDEE